MTQAHQPIRDVFANWQVPGTNPSPPIDILEKIVPLLAPGRADATQISVDTRDPGQLRLTLNPFAGCAFSEVRKEQLIDVLRVLDCAPIEARVLRLYRLGYALPDRLWLGVAPTGTGCVVKAYVASAEPIQRSWLPRLARDAGWLPPQMQPAFVTLYEKLVPALAVMEGVGISFNGDTWLGTTLYLRSRLSWPVYASADLAAFLDLVPTEALARLSDILPKTPPAFGWSLECDQRGAVVDFKAEIAVREPYGGAEVNEYGARLGIGTGAFDQLRDAIRTAGLSRSECPAPAVLSLRFVENALRSMVAYFAVEPTGLTPAARDS
jgi:hypothetical protein